MQNSECKMKRLGESVKLMMDFRRSLLRMQDAEFRMQNEKIRRNCKVNDDFRRSLKSFVFLLESSATSLMSS